ncbi:MAG: hypothetical protein AAF705_08270 [Bacteroidota bacterium]
MYRSVIHFCFLTLFIVACGNDVSVTPKPRTYPKVEYPVQSYQAYQAPSCDFAFTYPTYGQIEESLDAATATESDSECWFDIAFPDFKGRLHCSYYKIGAQKSFEDLKKDAFEMADYHNKRANYIDELIINRQDANVEGFVFAIEGPAATPFQFYLTDQEKHFFRASLYFDTKVRPDSIAPIYEFVREDMMKIIETFEWTD